MKERVHLVSPDSLCPSKGETGSKRKTRIRVRRASPSLCWLTPKQEIAQNWRVQPGTWYFWSYITSSTNAQGQVLDWPRPAENCSFK